MEWPQIKLLKMSHAPSQLRILTLDWSWYWCNWVWNKIMFTLSGLLCPLLVKIELMTYYLALEIDHVDYVINFLLRRDCHQLSSTLFACCSRWLYMYICNCMYLVQLLKGRYWSRTLTEIYVLVLKSSLLYWTHNFFIKNSKKCTNGTLDYLVRTGQNFIIYVCTRISTR